MDFWNQIKNVKTTFVKLEAWFNNIFSATINNRLLIEQSLILQGRALALQNTQRVFVDNIQAYEFKVFSQFGEDGIIQHLIKEASITQEEQTFIEFGVQDYSESNTRFLLMNDNWQGLIFDGDENNINFVKSQGIYWRHDLTAQANWISRQNINQLIKDAEFDGPLGLLSIDIDGNDYWVWESIKVVDPVIVIVEWNSVFGKEHAITIPYDEQFDRQQAHHSNLYWGGSIKAFHHLGFKKGYSLVGSNSAGNNLFFVRNDRLGRLKVLSPESGYVESKFRESRDPFGNLTYLRGKKRIDEIGSMRVFDVLNEETKTISEL